MKNENEYTPTPQELSETVRSMTLSQKMQLEAILNMVTSLLISVRQEQQGADRKIFEGVRK